MKFTVDLNWDDHSLEVAGHYDPGEEAKTSGPPENCYPGTPGGVDQVISVKVTRWRAGKCIGRREISQEMRENLEEDEAFMKALDEAVVEQSKDWE